MDTQFRNVALVGRQTDVRVAEPMRTLATYLTKSGVSVAAAETLALDLPVKRVAEESLCADADLVIAVGGDGTMLYASRLARESGTPILGVNRGRLGFLADITPDEMIASVEQVLAGNFLRDSRLLLKAQLTTSTGDESLEYGLNDVVVQRRGTGGMVDFSTSVAGQYVNTHSGDGLICATPTGSTAYALSCGGPILEPQLDAVALVPICPHTLTDRPIVIPASQEIKIVLLKRDDTRAEITVDGGHLGTLRPGDTLRVAAARQRITLLHPPGHDFYGILRSKLFWDAIAANVATRYRIPDMLMNLQVRDFAIVDRIDIEFEPGMTVLTGETGAGKSILVDALGLVLGERGNAQLVRNGAKRAEFAAQFDVSGIEAVSAWLDEQALDLDDECLLRRVINADGRSRAFINGNSVPLSQLKAIGELLLDIHGQHFHQSLGRREIQRDLLDHFGGLLERRAQVATQFVEWQSLSERLDDLTNAEADRASRLDLLTFQLQELETLALEATEVDELHSERQKLQNSGRLAEGAGTALDSLFDNETGNANSLVADALRSIEQLADIDPTLAPVVELLGGASIQVAEAADALRRYGEALDMDPARRDWVEERLDAVQTISRKHRVSAEELPELTDTLRTEHDELSHAEERGRELEEQADAAKTKFLKLAKSLSGARAKAASKFEAAVTEAMHGLGMPGGVFKVALESLGENAAKAWGLDNIGFLISANPGQPPQSLAKIASGGELSRMSLAIQVIASDGSAIPTMVFDEVDSGVGGGVAEMVGRRLQELGANRQVLCVTHLPQVASLADQHFRISKVSDGKSTRTRVQALGKDERVEELARMLGGVEITRKTLEHAAEMLAGGREKRA